MSAKGHSSVEEDPPDSSSSRGVDRSSREEELVKLSSFRGKLQNRLMLFAHSAKRLYAWLIIFGFLLGSALALAIYFAIPAAGLSFAALLGLTGPLAFVLPLLILSLASISFAIALLAFLLRLIFNNLSKPGFMKITLITSTLICGSSLGIFLAAASPSIFSLLPALGLTGPAALAVSLLLAAILNLAVMSIFAYSVYRATAIQRVEAKTPPKLLSPSLQPKSTKVPTPKQLTEKKEQKIELALIPAALFQKIATVDSEISDQLKTAQDACLNALSDPAFNVNDEENKPLQNLKAALRSFVAPAAVAKTGSIIKTVIPLQIAMLKIQLNEKSQKIPLCYGEGLGQLIKILLEYSPTSTNQEYHFYMKNTFGFAAKLLSHQFTQNGQIYIQFLESIHAGNKEQALLALRSLNSLRFDQELANHKALSVPRKAPYASSDPSSSLPDDEEGSHRYQPPLTRNFSQSSSIDTQQSVGASEPGNKTLAHQDNQQHSLRFNRELPPHLSPSPALPILFSVL